ncbi:MAG: ribonuclease P protein subunit [Desulfurococcales archaeon]|nr:ribonuclease P protein subunit [Desulfurococcales archaeon]
MTKKRSYSKGSIGHEFIGLYVEVVQHSDPGLVGVKGKVVWETQNMLVIRSVKGKQVRVPKRHGVFRFMRGKDLSWIVNGELINLRPEERVKEVSRRVKGGALR